MSARKANKAINKKPTKRSSKFRQAETDLLCSLVVSSDLTSNVSSKVKKIGRLASWNEIATAFNASSGVSVC